VRRLDAAFFFGVRRLDDAFGVRRPGAALVCGGSTPPFFCSAVSAAYFFNNAFLSRNAITASLNCFGFSIIRKWPTPSHVWKSRLGAMLR